MTHGASGDSIATPFLLPVPMFRPASFALLLVLAAPQGALAQDRAPASANTYIAPLQSNTAGPTTLAAPVTPSPSAPAPLAPSELKAVGGPDACADALRRENAAHQEAAAASQTMPAPLVLPPECGGSVRPAAGK